MFNLSSGYSQNFIKWWSGEEVESRIVPFVEHPF